MTLNPDLIRTRASEIGDSIGRLEQLAALPVDEFIASQDITDIACYRLVVAIEAALALCYHVSARRFRKAPEDYAACFAVLRDADLLPADLTDRLQRMARLRNLLVHMYGKVDHRLVHAIIQNDLPDLRAFVTAVVGLLDQPPAGDAAPPASGDPPA